MSTPYYADAGPLWAITSYYNPNRYGRRRANYTQFRRHLGLPLLAVELNLGGNFELVKDDAEILIRCQVGDVLWQKERLLNIALAALPRDCEQVVWVDCDLLFPRPDWIPEVRRQLELFPLVQPYSEVVHLPPEAIFSGLDWQGKTLLTKPSISSLIAEGISLETYVAGLDDRRQGTRAPGHVWAARRELIELCGIYDACIIGGGDTALVGAAFGAWEAVIRRQAMSGAQAVHYRNWAEPFFAATQGQLGCVEQAAMHLWHGDIEDRRYRQRFYDLSPFEFDPNKDICRGRDGAWQWASDKPGLHALLRDYFAVRNEDGARELVKAA